MCSATQRRELLLMREPEADDRRHAADRSAGFSRTARRRQHGSTSARTRGSSDSAIACGVPHQISRPLVQDADAIGQRQRLGHVVRDEDDALRDARLNAPELLLQLASRDRIERTERLVHQQHRRIDRQRARDADALTLSARQLVGPPARIRLRREADQLEQLAHARRDALVWPPLQPRHDGDVVGDA